MSKAAQTVQVSEVAASLGQECRTVRALGLTGTMPSATAVVAHDSYTAPLHMRVQGRQDRGGSGRRGGRRRCGWEQGSTL